ncbi:hypothetical protein JCM10213_001037 [Rhodosporidiobolus nylandii]
MDKLPDEIVLRVGEYLDIDRRPARKDSEAQRALACFARASRRYNILLNPLLYLHPRLSCPSGVTKWVRTYASLVDPFKRAAASKNWPPVVFRPAKLFCRYDGAYRPLPHVKDVLNDLGVFSCLTSLVVHGCEPNSNFLPLLIGPGAPLRTSLRTFTLSKCLNPRQSDGFNLCLAFLLQLGQLLDDPIECFYFEELEAGQADDHNPIEEGSPEYWDRYFDLLDEASLDFDLFAKAWSPDGWGGTPSFGDFLGVDPFYALSTLRLQVYRSEQLYLIFYTSNFPSLSFLTLLSGSDADVTPADIQTFRHSITPVPGRSPSSHGTFFPPTSWSMDDYDFLNSELLRVFELGKPLPPLSQEEIDGYFCGPYDGPRLKKLDMREAAIDLEF